MTLIRDPPSLLAVLTVVDVQLSRDKEELMLPSPRNRCPMFRSSSLPCNRMGILLRHDADVNVGWNGTRDTCVFTPDISMFKVEYS